MRLFIFLSFIFSVSVISAYSQENLREVDLRVNGIGSGSSYSAVLARFGRPTREEVERTEAALACSNSNEVYRTLYYPGMRLELLETDNNRKPTLVSFTITSTRWSASGIKIGATASQVVRKFGKPVSTDRKAGKMIYYYVTPGNLGGVNFEFIRGRLASVVMSETLC